MKCCSACCECCDRCRFPLFQNALDYQIHVNWVFFKRGEQGRRRGNILVIPARGGGGFSSSPRARTGGPPPVNRKGKNLLYNPACFRVDQKMTFFVRVFYIAQRCIGSIVCAIGKSCVHGSLDLLLVSRACISFRMFKNGASSLSPVDGVHIVIDGNVAYSLAK